VNVFVYSVVQLFRSFGLVFCFSCFPAKIPIGLLNVPSFVDNDLDGNNEFAYCLDGVFDRGFTDKNILRYCLVEPREIRVQNYVFHLT
jgi:hypothetical protein